MAMPTSVNLMSRSARHGVAWLVVLGLLAPLAACASEEMCSLRVQFRRGGVVGGEHQPVYPGVIFAETPSRDHPFSIATLLGQTGPKSTNVLPDERGEAVITIPRDRPLRLGVMTHDWGPGFVFLDPHPGLSGQARDWMPLQLEAGKGGDPRLLIEVRVEPVDDKPD